MSQTEERLNSTIDNTQDIINQFQNALSASKQGNLKVGTVVRLIVLVIAWINQIGVMFGLYTIPAANENVTYLIATIVTVVVSLVSYWKNNSWTTSANTADDIMAMLKNTGVTREQLVAACADMVDITNEARGVEVKDEETPVIEGNTDEDDSDVEPEE